MLLRLALVYGFYASINVGFVFNNIVHSSCSLATTPYVIILILKQSMTIMEVIGCAAELARTRETRLNVMLHQLDGQRARACASCHPLSDPPLRTYEGKHLHCNPLVLHPPNPPSTLSTSRLVPTIVNMQWSINRLR